MSRIWRISSSETGGVDAEQELQQEKPIIGDGGARRADGDGHERVRGVAQLAQPAGAVAGDEQHERGEAQRLGQHRVHEQPEPEAEHAPGTEPHSSPTDDRPGAA